MSGKEIKDEIEALQDRISVLLSERNKLIKERYSELYNVNTWNKVKLGYVNEIISKEFQLKPVTVINILREGMPKKKRNNN